MWTKMDNFPTNEAAAALVTTEAGEILTVKVWLSTDGYYRTSATRDDGTRGISTLSESENLDAAKAAALNLWRE